MSGSRRGLVALGDSITRGRGGSPTLAVHPQSWALWLAEALELPITNLGVDGAQAPDVVRDQLPRVAGPYDVATLMVGANDARAVEWDPLVFDAAVGAIVGDLVQAAAVVLVLTVPLDLGRPPAGAKVVAANEVLRRHAESHRALVCVLDDLRGPRVMLPDAVHPTSSGMVEIADRAAATLAAAGVVVAHRPSELPHAEERTDAVSRARYGAWYGWQVVRDRRRQWVEARRYRP